MGYGNISWTDDYNVVKSKNQRSGGSVDILDKFTDEMMKKFKLESRDECREFVKRVVDESHEFYQMKIKKLAQENMEMREVLMDLCIFMGVSGVKKKAK